MKVVNIDGQNLHIFWTTWGIDEEKDLEEKDVTYDNIKSHKKSGLYPLYRRYIIGKTTGGQINFFSLLRFNELLNLILVLQWRAGKTEF